MQFGWVLLSQPYVFPISWEILTLMDFPVLRKSYIFRKVIFCKNAHKSGNNTKYLARSIFSSLVNDDLLATNDDAVESWHQGEFVFKHIAESKEQSSTVEIELECPFNWSPVDAFVYFYPPALLPLNLLFAQYHVLKTPVYLGSYIFKPVCSRWLVRAGSLHTCLLRRVSARGVSCATSIRAALLSCGSRSLVAPPRLSSCSGAIQRMQAQQILPYFTLSCCLINIFPMDKRACIWDPLVCLFRCEGSCFWILLF